MENKVITFNDLSCCKQRPKGGKKNGLYIIFCEKCNAKAHGKTEQGAIEAFYGVMHGEPQAEPQDITNTTTEMVVSPMPTPQSPEQLQEFMVANAQQISAIAAPFVSKDTPAFNRMIQKNLRYVTNQKDKNFLACWKTKEGAESIIYAMEEAFQLGAVMPEMGCMVPFGGVVEFIPAVEAYEFAMTNGEKSPFKWVNIEIIHENDQRKISRKNGEFNVEIEPGVPRGAVVAVCVYGLYNKTGKVKGELYDASTLLEKAKKHSKSYRRYLKDKADFEQLRSEGKLEKDNFGYYKMMGGKNGSWKKYQDDLENPYEGPDQPQMLRKVAGKSFLAPYVKRRNSEEAMEEIRGQKEPERIIDAALDNAMNSMDEPKEV